MKKMKTGLTRWVTEVILFLGFNENYKLKSDGLSLKSAIKIISAICAFHVAVIFYLNLVVAAGCDFYPDKLLSIYLWAYNRSCIFHNFYDFVHVGNTAHCQLFFQIIEVKAGAAGEDLHAFCF